MQVILHISVFVGILLVLPITLFINIAIMKGANFDFQKAAKLLDEFAKGEAKTIIGVEAVNFFKSNFDVVGFQDKGTSKWKPVSEARRKQKPSGSKTLTDKGYLKGSIRWEPTATGVTIFTDEPYAQIHNEGGKITVTYTVSSHTRKTKYGPVQVSEHSRTVNTEMPQRQFIGESQTLVRILESKLATRIKAILEQCNI